MTATVHNNQNSVCSASTASVTITSGGSGYCGVGHNTAVGYATPLAITTGVNSNSWSNNTGPSYAKFPGSVDFQGDITWKGRDLGLLIESIEDRLAILVEPTPERLEKFAALKKAYDQYKLMEKLIGED